MTILAAIKGQERGFLLNNETLEVADWQCVEAGYGCDYIYGHMTVTHDEVHSFKPVHESTTFLAWTYAHAPIGKSDVGYGMLTGMNCEFIVALSM